MGWGNSYGTEKGDKATVVALGTLTATAGAGAGVAALATTTLYRAVSATELAELMATGTFRNLPGLEAKYFSTTLAGARQYADMAAKAFGEALTIVRTSIPTSAISPTMRATVDRGIPTVVLPTSRLPQLASPKVVR